MFKVGQTIEGRYEIKETFSGGGMGIVHRAHHTKWAIEIAIKHPRADFLGEMDQVQQFHQECKTWSSIGLDPYITTCFYSHEISGLPCVVAEFVNGGSLQHAIQSRALYQGDDDCLPHLLAIAASTSWGMARAHQEQLLHCDIKPANILLTEYGTAKIADFGLAVAFRPSLLVPKAAGLTVAFASPEQLKGDSLTPAADVWSWAATMLAMFSGGVTWEYGAACGAALRQYLDEGGKAYRIPAMPGEFANLLEACLCYSPDSRISCFDRIAERICSIYETILDEPCPAQRQDFELTSADSLNNRAVSHLDLGQHTEARKLFNDALSVDSLHPEANYNAALLEYKSTGMLSQLFKDSLEQDTAIEPGEYRPRLYLACLLNLCGSTREAAEHLNHAYEIANDSESQEIKRLWDLSNERNLSPLLAPPIAGDDFAHDSARFARLMNKAELAINEQRLEDARRYLLMAGDITGFGRHVKRRRLLLQFKS